MTRPGAVSLPGSEKVKKNEREVLRQGHIRMITCMAWSPDGKFIACGGVDRRIKIWDAKADRVVAVLKGMKDDPWDLVWSPGDYIIAVCLDGKIYRWKFPPGGDPESFKAHDDSILSIALMQGNEKFATAALDGTVKIWELHKKEPGIIVAHKGEKALSVAPVGNCLSAGFGDGKILVRSLDGEGESRYLYGYSPVIGLAGVPGREMLVSADENGNVKFWNVKSGYCIEKITMEREIEALDISSAGDLLAFALSGGKVGILSVQEPGKKARYLTGGTKAGYNSVAFSPSGNELGATGRDGSIWLWSMDDGRSRRLDAFEKEIYDVAFLGNRYCISCGRDRRVYAWDVAEKKLARTGKNQLPGPGSALLVLPGKSFISADLSGNIALWEGDPQNGFSIKIKCPVESEVWKLRLSPCNEVVLAACEDGFIRSWNLPNLEKRPPFLAHNDSVVNLIFSKDGKLLFTGSCDNTIHVYT
ncbi:MAG: WD40 repeat domain-containing protein, partial [Candidatus Eremiobacteraeota bacterium]|nr:WD40 repeat domain-containing protein [Candidatus Eremiobacteraeota bacterium]